VYARLLAHLAARRGWRAGVTVFGLGALAALALPPVHALPVLLLAIPGLLVMLGATPSWRRAAWLGFLFFWGHHIAGLYWITHALLTDTERWWWLVPIAVPALAVPLAGFGVLPALAAARAPAGLSRVLAFTAAWVASELLRGVLFTGFPWNLLGTVWAFDAWPLQAAAWIGVHGLSAATLLIAAAPLFGRRGMLAAAAGLAGFAAFGLARLWPEEKPPEPIALVLVQGNIAQEVKWSEAARLPIFARYLELTEQGVAGALAESPPGTRVVAIWPETASPFLLATDPEAQRFVAEALPDGATLLAGSVRAEWGADRRLAALFNAVVALDATGAPLGAYDKSHLVPFGEYMPLRGLLPVRMVHGAMDFSAGPGRVAWRLPGLPAVSPLVCYEVIFPARVVGAERPGWLLNVTNDAWFGVSAGPFQHLASARLRAVEEGLPLVRAAQTGISAVFDSRGREVARLGLARTGVLVAPLPAAGEETPFSRAGLWVPWALVVVLGVGAMRVARRATRAGLG
jgi:apolipoprotein N-acyltransferase